LPDAHSGPAFSTLVGLALLAGSGSGDIRDIALGPIARQTPSRGMFGRLMSAMKGGF
jgi:cell division protein FtsA